MLLRWQSGGRGWRGIKNLTLDMMYRNRNAQYEDAVEGFCLRGTKGELLNQQAADHGLVARPMESLAAVRTVSDPAGEVLDACLENLLFLGASSSYRVPPREWQLRRDTRSQPVPPNHLTDGCAVSELVLTAHFIVPANRGTAVDRQPTDRSARMLCSRPFEG